MSSALTVNAMSGRPRGATPTSIAAHLALAACRPQGFIEVSGADPREWKRLVAAMYGHLFNGARVDRARKGDTPEEAREKRTLASQAAAFELGRQLAMVAR